MEDKDFDRIIKEKLAEADVPVYKESKWAAFSRLLPAVSGRNNWPVYSLLALLLLSNLGWWWFTQAKSGGDGDHPVSNHSKQATPSDISFKTVTIYDTVYHTVEVERVVYKTLYIEGTEDDLTLLAANLKSDFGEELDHFGKHTSERVLKLRENNFETDSLNHPGGEAPADETEKNLLVKNAEGLVAEDTLEEETDSIESEPVVVLDEEERNEIIREQPKPYFGDRILAGLHYYKPFVASGHALEFGGNDIGVSLEYILNHWIRLSGGLHYYSQNFRMTDQELYEENTGGYGSGYTFVSSDLSERAFQYQVGFQLSPLKLGSWRPFLGAYFGESLYSQTSITNRLRENISNKIFLVEGTNPEASRNNFIQTELGVEKTLSYDLRFRVGLGYRYSWQQQSYTRNLIGINAGIFYRVK